MEKMARRTLQKILHVDDDANLLALLKIVLEERDKLTLMTCGSGPEALEKVMAFAPDLLLVDVNMPDMDGLTMVETLRKMPGVANIPVIFLSADTHPDLIERSKALGALDFIRKPLEPAIFKDQLEIIWNQNLEM